MKRFLALLTLLCLVALPALADTTVCDFGDFTWEIDNELVGSIVEKAENTPFITLFPNYAEENEFHVNINCVWSQNQVDVTAMTEAVVAATAQVILDGTIAQYKTLGYDVKDGSVLQAAVLDMEEWGKPVLLTTSTYKIDLKKSGEYNELYLMQIYVGGTFGTYVFSATAGDSVDNLEPCMDLMDGIVWVN